MAGYVHDDVKEIMEDAADSVHQTFPSTKGFTDEQLKSVDVMLQFAWNRGYKSACQDLDE